MRNKNRIRAILVTLACTLIFIPAMVFADNEDGGGTATCPPHVDVLDSDGAQGADGYCDICDGFLCATVGDRLLVEEELEGYFKSHANEDIELKAYWFEGSNGASIFVPEEYTGTLTVDANEAGYVDQEEPDLDIYFGSEQGSLVVKNGYVGKIDVRAADKITVKSGCTLGDLCVDNACEATIEKGATVKNVSMGNSDAVLNIKGKIIDEEVADQFVVTAGTVNIFDGAEVDVTIGLCGDAATANVSGGTVKGIEAAASEGEQPEVNISGGTVGSVYVNAGSIDLTVSGGSVESVGFTTGYYKPMGGDVSITGGTVGTLDLEGFTDDTKQITVSGGAIENINGYSEDIVKTDGVEIVKNDDGSYSVEDALKPIKTFGSWSAPSKYYFEDETPIPECTTQATIPTIKRDGETTAHEAEDFVEISWAVTDKAATAADGAATTIASVDDKGLVTFTEPGSVKLWLTMTDRAGTKSASKTISYTPAVTSMTVDGEKTGYGTLSAAITAAKGKAGATVTVLADQTATGVLNRFNLGEDYDFTLDLGGKTLTMNGAYFTLNGAKMTVTNGTITTKGNMGQEFTVNAGELNVTDSATIIGNKGVGAIAVFGPATINTAGTITAENSFAIAGNGSTGKGGYTINVTGGSVTSETETAIYHPNEGTVNVSGGTIAGATGIYQKAGELNITGGTVKGTGDKAAYTYNGNGANATGDAVVVDNCGYPGGVPAPAITGGTITSEKADAVASYQYGDGNEAVEKFIEGGVFSSDVSGLLGEGVALASVTDKTGTMYAASEELIQSIAADAAEGDIIAITAGDVAIEETGAVVVNEGEGAVTLGGEAVKNLADTLSDLNMELTEANANIAYLREQVTELNEQIETANGTITELESTIEDLNQQLEQAGADKEALNETIEGLQSQLDEANDTIEGLNGQVTSLTKDITDANDTISDLNDQITTLTTERDEAIAASLSMSATVESLTAQLEEANGNVTELAKAVGPMAERLAAAYDEITSLTDSVASLTAQLKTANEQLADAIADKESLTAQLNEANQDLDAANAEKERLAGELEAKEAEIAELKTALAAASGDAESLQTQLDAANEEKADLAAQLETAQANVNRLTTSTESLTTQLEAANTKVADLEEKLAAAQNSSQGLQEQVGDLENALNNANSQIENLQQQVGDLSTQLDALKNEKLEASMVDISNYAYTLSKTSYAYTGKEIKPAVSVKGLTKDDFTVAYKNNKAIGTATVTISGNKEKNYKGEITATFKITKRANTLTVTARTATVKASAVKKKTQTLKVSKVLTVKKNVGKVTYVKSSGNKKITIAKTTGKVTVKKGLKKGTYKVKVKVTAAGTTTYSKKTLTRTFTVKVK